MTNDNSFYEFNIPIRQFVTKRLVGIDKNSTIQEAAKKMDDLNVGSLVVLENKKIVGFFTVGDIMSKVVAKGKKSDIPVEKIMIKSLITTDINSSVRDALEIMAKNDIKHLLIKKNEEIIGILTYKDLMDIDRHNLETFISR
ncbi:MAG: CBS domain-containing protein [Candidatus Cloacimonetes bacterium]|nr:CBS domain-containing protein [Candidatus Cloacimonadota bacterium]MBS3767362.1 CBS domain-containing protein [Candidatus Cloacimonadota bacterium]